MRTAFAENDVGELQMFAETDEIAVLCLEGEFDLANAPQILEEGGRLLADDKQLILDLSDATFIDALVIDAVSRLGTDASKNGARSSCSLVRPRLSNESSRSATSIASCPAHIPEPRPSTRSARCNGRPPNRDHAALCGRKRIVIQPSSSCSSNQVCHRPHQR